MLQGIFILLLVGSLTFDWGINNRRMHAIADGMPTLSTTPSKVPVKSTAKTSVKTTAKVPASIADVVRKDLSKQTGIPANKLQLVQSTPKTWSDGCLGLARADEMCSQAMVPGWQVVFSNGTQRWVYRTNSTGKVYRMETPNT